MPEGSLREDPGPQDGPDVRVHLLPVSRVFATQLLPAGIPRCYGLRHGGPVPLQEQAGRNMGSLVAVRVLQYEGGTGR